MSAGGSRERDRNGATPFDPQQFGIGRLFNAIRDAVVVADDEGRIVLWNAGAIAIFGYTPNEAVGMDVATLVPPEYRKQHLRGIRRYRSTGHGTLIDSRTAVELPALTKSGERVVIELTLAPLESDGQRFALAMIRDVTERARLHRDLELRTREIERANRALRDANESLEAFTYVVSHDLKEPVRGIDAYLRALHEDHEAELSEEALELLVRAQSSTRRLGDLLRGLLEFSRVSQSASTPERLLIDQVLDSPTCRTSFEGLLRERNARLDVSAAIPPILGTYALVCQVLGNLVSNAVRHNDSSEPVVEVNGVAREDGFVEVVVEDNGPGFPERMAERINARSMGIAQSASGAAGGFGVLIAARAAERSNGRLWVGRSRRLGGAAVHVTFPLHTEGAPPAGSTSSP